MRNANCAAMLALLGLLIFGVCAVAQDGPALLVVPSKATMLVGETHTFRAVGPDGHIRHNVSWSVSPASAATLTTDGDEATVRAEEPSSFALSADANSDSAEASIEVRSGASLPMGAVKWSVTELPGCKTTKITPAVPSANGPDIYVQETCPESTFVRAITDDGRELWRRNISLPIDSRPAAFKAKAEPQPGERLDLNARSLCDYISNGMTKDTITKLAQNRDLTAKRNFQQIAITSSRVLSCED